nr:MAG TPA: hypothetical protein [Caudoviricetes sp.]
MGVKAFGLIWWSYFYTRIYLQVCSKSSQNRNHEHRYTLHRL